MIGVDPVCAFIVKLINIEHKKKTKSQKINLQATQR